MKTKMNFVKKLILAATLLPLLAVVTPEVAEASHFRYGHLIWQPVSGNTVSLTFTASFRRTGYSGTAFDGYPAIGDIILETVGATGLNFGHGAAYTGTLRFKVIAIDVAEDWVLARALQPSSNTKESIDYTYPTPTNGGSPWVAYVEDCCRLNPGTGGGAGMITNGAGNYRVATNIDLSQGNTSPSSSLPAIISLTKSVSPSCVPSTFIVPAADPDASSTLRFRLATSAEAGPGFFQPPGLTIDNLTGQVSWNTCSAVLTGLYACQVIIEDRDVNTLALKTQVGVDFLIRIVACQTANTAPVFVTPTPVCGSIITVQENEPVTFTVTASDADAGNIVSLNSAGLPAGATNTPSLPITSNPVSTTFNWTPGAGSAGTHVVTYSATDGCAAQALCSFTINVVSCTSPTISCPANISSSVNAGSCSAIVNFDATVTGSPAPSVTYSHAPGSAFPVGTTTVTATATNACGSVSCTFDVIVSNDLSVNAGTDAETFFGYTALQFLSRTATASGGTPPYSYSWTMNRSLRCNVLNSAGDEAFSGGSCIYNACPSSGSPINPPSCSGSATVNAKLIEDGILCVTVTDANGCTATDCFLLEAKDARCFAGNSGNYKVKVCHSTSSGNNPWVQICIAQEAVPAHLAEHGNDYIGTCGARFATGNLTVEQEFSVQPNPVNGLATFKFSLPEEGEAQVELYSTAGNKVAVIFNGFVDANDIYEVELNSHDFANGIYLCKLTTGNQVVYKKVMVAN